MPINGSLPTEYNITVTKQVNRERVCYLATDIFEFFRPENTVTDITNIDNWSAVRDIVASFQLRSKRSCLDVG